MSRKQGSAGLCRGRRVLPKRPQHDENCGDSDCGKRAWDEPIRPRCSARPSLGVAASNRQPPSIAAGTPATPDFRTSLRAGRIRFPASRLRPALFVHRGTLVRPGQRKHLVKPGFSDCLFVRGSYTMTAIKKMLLPVALLAL